MTGFSEPDRQKLPLVVPLVQRLADRQALITLQPDEFRTKSGRQRLGCCGLADSRLPFQQQRAPENQCEEHRSGHALVNEVADLIQAALDVGYVGDAVPRCHLPASARW